MATNQLTAPSPLVLPNQPIVHSGGRVHGYCCWRCRVAVAVDMAVIVTVSVDFIGFGATIRTRQDIQ